MDVQRTGMNWKMRKTLNLATNGESPIGNDYGYFTFSLWRVYAFFIPKNIM